MSSQTHLHFDFWTVHQLLSDLAPGESSAWAVAAHVSPSAGVAITMRYSQPSARKFGVAHSYVLVEQSLDTQML